MIIENHGIVFRISVGILLYTPLYYSDFGIYFDSIILMNLICFYLHCPYKVGFPAELTLYLPCYLPITLTNSWDLDQT